MCTDTYREASLRSFRPRKAAKILPSPSHKPDVLRACSCLTYLQSSLPSPWGPHPHLTQPVLAPTSLLEEKHFFSFCHGICPASQFSCHLSTTPYSTFWPCLLVHAGQVLLFVIFSFFNLSSPLPVLAPSVLEWFALRSQLPNSMHSCTFRKFQPRVSEKYSGEMLYFSCEATARLHTSTCVNGDTRILITLNIPGCSKNSQSTSLM